MNANEMKAKLDELKEKRRLLSKEIEQLEQDYAEAACPWPKDTVLEDTRTDRRYIVDGQMFQRGDWAVLCTHIKKDGLFGQRTESIFADYAGWYKVVRGVTVTENGIVKTTEEKLAAWQDAVK